MNYVIIFFVTVFCLSVGFKQAERDSTFKISDVSYRKGMEIQDSLWQIIKAIELLDNKYYILDKRYYEKMLHDGYDIREGTEIYIKR